MKKLLLLTLTLLSIASTFSGCEKPDYQHPMHRNGSK